MFCQFNRPGADLRSLNEKQNTCKWWSERFGQPNDKRFVIREAEDQISYLFIKRQEFFYIFKGFLDIFLVTRCRVTSLYGKIKPMKQVFWTNWVVGPQMFVRVRKKGVNKCPRFLADERVTYQNPLSLWSYITSRLNDVASLTQEFLVWWNPLSNLF